MSFKVTGQLITTTLTVKFTNEQGVTVNTNADSTPIVTLYLNGSLVDPAPIFSVLSSATGVYTTVWTPAVSGQYKVSWGFSVSSVAYVQTEDVFVMGVETNLFTLKNKPTYQGKTNKIQAVLQSISLLNDTNGSGTFRLWENATLTGSVFTDINSSTSVMAQDTVGTVSGGKLLWMGGVGKNNGEQIDLSVLSIKMRVGNTYSLTAQTLGSVNPMSAIAVWVEDY